VRAEITGDSENVRITELSGCEYQVRPAKYVPFSLHLRLIRLRGQLLADASVGDLPEGISVGWHLLIRVRLEGNELRLGRLSVKWAGKFTHRPLRAGVLRHIGVRRRAGGSGAAEVSERVGSGEPRLRASWHGRSACFSDSGANTSPCCAADECIGPSAPALLCHLGVRRPAGASGAAGFSGDAVAPVGRGHGRSATDESACSIGGRQGIGGCATDADSNPMNSCIGPSALARPRHRGLVSTTRPRWRAQAPTVRHDGPVGGALPSTLRVWFSDSILNAGTVVVL